MKKMVVTYNSVYGVPVGRHERGNVIVYSGCDYCRYGDAGTPFTWAEQVSEAEKKTAELKKDLIADVDSIDEAYVYVGVTAMNGAMNLIRHLLKAGKKVHMVACDCDSERKSQFAEALSIDWIECECGGRETCEALVNGLAS